MKKFRRMLVVAFALAMTGCVTLQPVVERKAKLEPDVAYIAGAFSGKGQGFGLGFTNASSGTPYLMPFFTYRSVVTAVLSARFHDHDESVSIIAVPPGTYKVTHWATYEPSTKERILEKQIESEVAPTFEAKAGRVVFAGRFKASQLLTPDRRHVEFRIFPLPISRSEVVEKVGTAYPNVSSDVIDF